MSRILADRILDINYLEESSGSKKAEASFRKLEVDNENKEENQLLGLKGMSPAERYKSGATIDAHNAGTTARASIAKARETDNPREKSKLYKAAKGMIKIGKDSKKTMRHPLANTERKSLLKKIPATAITAAASWGATKLALDGGLADLGITLASAVPYSGVMGALSRGLNKDTNKHVASEKDSYNNKILNTAKNTGVTPKLVNSTSIKEKLNSTKNRVGK